MHHRRRHTQSCTDDVDNGDARDRFADERGRARDGASPSASAEAAALPSNRTGVVMLAFAVVGAPFLFGSVEAPFSALWAGVLGLGTISLSTSQLRRGHLLLLAGILVVVLCYAVVLHEQLADRPWIAPFHPTWGETQELLGAPVHASASVARGQPFWALGPPIANTLALVCGLVLGTDRTRARQVLSVIGWSGAVFAAYGIFELLLDPTATLWREKTAYIGNLTATFINRNTAAAYFGSCAVVWLLLLLEQVLRPPPGAIEWRQVPKRLLTEASRAVIVALAMLFLCVAALFMTASRAGVLLSLLALIIAFIVFFRRHLSPRSGYFGALAGAAAVVWILLQFMGGSVETRIDQQGLSDVGRLEAWRSTLRMIADHPWFGTGLGTYRWAFPPYRSPNVSMVGIWDRAHSTPLELASEVGIPLAGAVAVGWIIILGVLVHGIRMRRQDRIVPLAAFCVSLIALMHSCIDFSLQIPGYAIVVFALVGIGLAQSFRSEPGGHRSPRGRHRG